MFLQRQGMSSVCLYVLLLLQSLSLTCPKLLNFHSPIDKSYDFHSSEFFASLLGFQRLYVAKSRETASAPKTNRFKNIRSFSNPDSKLENITQADFKLDIL